MYTQSKKEFNLHIIILYILTVCGGFRVKQCSVENANLLKKVKALQSENQTLCAQLRRVQGLVGNGGGSNGGVGGGTCLVVLVLSLALLAGRRGGEEQPPVWAEPPLEGADLSSTTAVVTELVSSPPPPHLDHDYTSQRVKRTSPSAVWPPSQSVESPPRPFLSPPPHPHLILDDPDDDPLLL
jgi:hypothetical protein